MSRVWVVQGMGSLCHGRLNLSWSCFPTIDDYTLAIFAAIHADHLGLRQRGKRRHRVERVSWLLEQCTG